MNEKALAEQLEQDIEHLLNGHSLPSDTSDEYGQVLDAAHMLIHNDMSEQSRIRKSLKQELLTRASTRRKAWFSKERGTYAMKLRTKLFVFATTIAAMILGVVAIPPARAFAQEILNRVGPLIIVSESGAPTNEAPADFNPTPVPNSGGQTQLIPELNGPTPKPGEGSGQDVPSNGPTPMAADPNVQNMTIADAFARLNFKVLVPAYLPDDYYFSNDPNLVHVQGDRIDAHAVYTTDGDSYTSAYLSIQQSTFQTEDAREFVVGDAEVTQLTVRGQAAIFVEDALLMTVQDRSGNNVNLPVDYLMWEENGYFFVIDATELSKEQMIRIAESLK